ncbi:MAG TPA: DNA gyrase C-terminal beta-propeller domain-containing protein, partial [Pelobium sp.]|nr:DNA gyrase C-terminal beta-propeller domain-containing protein [Pelobium sp.]
GKRTDVDDYRVTNRGGKGVKTINVTEKTGQLVSIKDVTNNDDLMIINRSGIVIRIAMSNLRVMGRATQGVRLITLKGEDAISSVAKVQHDEEEETVEVIVDETDVASAEGVEEDIDEEDDLPEDDASADDTTSNDEEEEDKE